jgi:hypothetical protein
VPKVTATPPLVAGKPVRFSTPFCRKPQYMAVAVENTEPLPPEL